MKSLMKLIIASVVILALLAAPAMARTPDLKTLANTDVAFVYESGLNIPALDGSHAATKLVKFGNDNPDSSVAGGGQQLAEIPCDSPGVCSINTAPPYMGIWFPWNSTYSGGATGNVNKAVYIQIQHADATLDAVLSVDHTSSIGGKSVTRETAIAFKLISTYAATYFKYTDGGGVVHNSSLVDIEVTTPGGGKVQIFGANAVNLQNIAMGQSVIYTDSYISPLNAAIDLTGVEAGTYSATAKWDTTMPWYNLESNSNAATFTVLSKPITITTNKESVVRGNTFVVTVTGESKKPYWVYLKDASVATNYFYPQISLGQSNVNIGVNATLTFGSLGVNTSMATDVNPAYPLTANNYTAANITTAADGTRAIQFATTSKTYDTRYTIKAVDPTDLSKYDTVDVTVQKGQVTITYEGTGTYYLGETIKLTGTNTDSETVYLFLVGPNLATNGVSVADIQVAAKDNDANTFKAVDVNTDNTWSYKWDTSQLTETLDAGTYTIYAAAQPQNKGNLTNVEYGTASVVLKKPFITASVSASTLAKGDILYVRGIAEGKPNNVFVWTFGKNYRNCEQSASVKTDASYEYKYDRGDTEDLYAGQYFVVVQHPMMNGIPDIVGVPTGTGCVWAQATTSTKFTSNVTPVKLSGLQASDAASALVDMLNLQSIDDTYTKLSFMVEEPWMRIDTIGDKYVGEAFKITGTTNLAEGDQILMTVTSSSFQPTEKTQTGEFSGSSGTVTVQKGDTYNTFSFDVDTATFKPDEYLVKAESVQPSQTTTATFNVLEGKPTTVATPERTPIVTMPETPIRTTAPPTTAVPTTTAKPQPGFGALVALVGLGAVALLVLRRR